MDQKTRQEKERHTWRRLATSYDERTLATYQRAHELSIEKAVRVVSGEDDVLEIGCGTGIVTLGVTPYARRVVGTDISPEMITVAQAKAEREGVTNVAFRVGDGYHHPDADGTFDVVLLFNLLHVVKEQESILWKARRLLKPGGFYGKRHGLLCRAGPAACPDAPGHSTDDEAGWGHSLCPVLSQTGPA